jgi:hypothetical protein
MKDRVDNLPTSMFIVGKLLAILNFRDCN